MSSVEVSFPGGVRVDATYRGLTVQTDQPEPLGTNTAMSPFDLFLASLATCAGFYALRFCQQREIPADGLGITLTPHRNEGEKRVSTISIDVRLPAGFPEKYQEAILRSVDQCAVKKALHEPPEFEVRAV